MKMKKRLWSILLSLVLVLGLVPGMSLTAYAAPTETLLTTITATGKEQASYSTAGVATVSFSYTANGSSSYTNNGTTATWGWWGCGWSATVNAVDGYTITKCVFYDDKDRTATDSEAPFVVETTEEDKTPQVNGAPILAYQSKGITKIEVYGYATPAHTHDFTYSASGATITATCGATGCTLDDGNGNHTATLTIAAEGGTYDGTTAYSATVTNNIPAVTGDTVGDVAYYKVDTQGATTGGTVQTGAPTGAGYYYASVTLTSGSNTYTAVKAFTVAKIDPTAPTGLTATYGQKLSDVVLPTGWTWDDSTQSVGNVVSPAATFKANFAGDDNYNAASNVDVTVTVSKADATTAMQAASVSIAGTSGKTATVSYALPDGASYGAVTNSNTEFFTVDTTNGLVLTAAKSWTASDWATDASKTFTVAVSGATNYNNYTLTVTVTPTYKATQTITAADVTATYGDTDAKIEATTTSGGGTLSYMVKSGDAVTVNENTGALTIVKAGSAVITVTAAENDTYAAATKDVNVTVNTKAMTVSAENVNVYVDGQPHGITVNVTEPATGYTVKYGTEAGTYDQTTSPTQTEAGEKTVYYQVTADNYTTYTGSAKVTVSAKQTQTITADNVTASYGDTGKKIEASTTGDGGLSYAVKSGDAVTVDETTGALTIVKAGSAVITVTASETATYTQATKDVTVTINKANAVAATVTANNRTYDGTEKPLVTVTGEPTGGTMQYALGTATEASEQYTTSIPTATDAGTYYVWYKAVGDETHTDSEAKCITVTISSESSGGGGGSSSSGGGSSTPSTPTTPTESYTVPVSSENTVNVTTNISNGTAVVSEITQSDIDKIVDNGNNSGGGDNTEASENTSITIDLSQAKSEVTSVQLTKETVEKLTEAVNAHDNLESVEIKMSKATVELDGKALSAVSEQAEGSSIKLVVKDTQTTKLNASQQESLKQFTSAQPFQAYFESKGKEIHDFKGGKATVSIKFSPETGKDVKYYHMYYLPLAGAIERYETRYIDGMLNFVTGHFSDYAIVYDETRKNETGKEDEDDNTDTDDNNGTDDGKTTEETSETTANGKTAYQNALSINKGLKVSQTGNKITVSWGKVSGADRYEIYAAYCTDKFGKKPVKIITKKDVTSVTITKLNGKKLVLTKNFKAYVVAYKTVDGSKKKLGKTITAHIVGRKNKTYTNVKAIKLAKNKTTIKVGKTYKIKASVVLVDSKKKMLSDKHAATFRYASSNKKIAAVDKNGKVIAKKVGTCYIWVYAKNGYAKKVKITVK